MRRGRLCITIVSFGFLALTACVPFPTSNPVSTYKDLREVIRSEGGDFDLPDVSIILNSSGGDAIEVYTEGTEDEQINIAGGVTEHLTEEFAVATPDEFEANVATVQLDRRLAQRSGDRWELTVDAGDLREAVESAGYDGFNLIVCHPAVATTISSSRPPDFEACFNGSGWVVDESPLNVTFTLLPSDNDYLAFVAAVLLGLVLLTTLAWFIGTKLREGPFRRRSASAVALGLIAGGLVIVGVASTVGLAAADLGPSDNLALAHDLDAGLHALSAAIPALIGVLPGLIFMILLVKGRPWPEEPAPEQRPWPPPPPPPGPPGAPPPPPLTWGGR